VRHLRQEALSAMLAAPLGRRFILVIISGFAAFRGAEFCVRLLGPKPRFAMGTMPKFHKGRF
jgi:hypothetical protein